VGGRLGGWVGGCVSVRVCVCAFVCMCLFADSFKSPAYRKASISNTPSHFADTYSRMQHLGAAAKEDDVHADTLATYFDILQHTTYVHT